ncbi:hypothetical protein ABC304_09930 [Microbacterium sp. 1P10UB]|uniref:hypothetical protein n=1 Tax=unclassified Microbacterium TaxID=2609290 RepID=UPI0039A0615C
MTIEQELPEEENFESLVARLRPLTVQKEPIHYAKVLAEIETALSASADDAAQALRPELARLRTAWGVAEIQGTRVQGYMIQLQDADGTVHPPTSDTVLAAGWLYIDLVHADPFGPKADALRHEFQERYTAAVRIFSEIALVTLETLDLVRRLAESGDGVVPIEVWEEQVVVEADRRQAARMFLARPGTPLPDLRDGPGRPEGWNQFTITELLRQDADKQVAVRLLDGEDQAQEIEAALIQQRREGDAIHRDVLVGGCAIFTFTFTIDGSKAVGCDLTSDVYLDSTNALKLASTRLALRLHQAARVEVVFPDGVVAFAPAKLSEQESREYEVVAEAIKDLVRIEEITGKPLSPANDRFTDLDRVRLRQTRLLWEGRLVHSRLSSVVIMSSSGEAPKVIGVREGTIGFGGSTVPTPTTLLWHEHAKVDHEPAAGGGDDPRDFRMTAPAGAYFVAWSPDRLAAPSQSQRIEPWGLLGIDEATFV